MDLVILKLLRLIVGLVEFEALMKNEGPYDYVFNLSALKHVRSEKDPLYTYAYDYGECLQYS